MKYTKDCINEYKGVDKISRIHYSNFPFTLSPSICNFMLFICLFPIKELYSYRGCVVILFTIVGLTFDTCLVY